MMRSKILKGAVPLTAILFTVFLTACMTTNPVRVLPRVGASLYPPTEPETVLILRMEPSKPYEILGQIIIEPESVLPAAQIEQMLQQEAARIGADAVVIVSDMSMQVGETREEMSGGQVIAANAIKYKN